MVDLKKDFGASGNGKEMSIDNKTNTLDHRAFEAAADFINARGGNVKLRIPYGTYVIGHQVFIQGKINHHNRSGNGENASFDGFEALLLRKVSNVVIEGVLSSKGVLPELLYKKGMRFGLFETVRGEKTSKGPEPGTTNLYLDNTNQQRAHIGNTISLMGCNNVVIKNIEIDGNAAAFTLGGNFGRGRNPFENYHTGIYITSCSSVQVLNLFVHEMGLDGIAVKDAGSGWPTSQHILIKDCVVRRNGRNGFSWLSGRGINVVNSEFSEMGTGIVSTEPAAGIDIEAEVSDPEGAPSSGNFNNCLIRDNQWLALAAGVAVSGSRKLPSSKMSFINCTFIGSRNNIADIESNEYRFESCNFYGMLYLRNNSEDEKNATGFLNCSFSNIYKGKRMAGDFFIANVGAKRTSFRKCSFTGFDQRIFDMDNAEMICGDYKSYPQYEDCIFKCYIREITDNWFKTSGLGGKTKYKNNTFYYNALYPFFNDTSCGNMGAQDLGGNTYIPLSKAEIIKKFNGN
ncbi:MAG: right-handed parallel beta-helix repeat-containing protein [Ferruginibacter sp.]